MEHAFDLNLYVSETRYPDSCLLIPDRATVKQAIEQAAQVLEFVKSALP